MRTSIHSSQNRITASQSQNAIAKEITTQQKRVQRSNKCPDKNSHGCKCHPIGGAIKSASKGKSTPHGQYSSRNKENRGQGVNTNHGDYSSEGICFHPIYEYQTCMFYLAVCEVIERDPK